MQLLAKHSTTLIRRYFRKTMCMFAPLYLFNECINSCAYCGFARENSILRVALEIDEVAKEARHLAAQGFHNLLLVRLVNIRSLSLINTWNVVYVS